MGVTVAYASYTQASPQELERAARRPTALPSNVRNLIALLPCSTTMTPRFTEIYRDDVALELGATEIRDHQDIAYFLPFRPLPGAVLQVRLHQAGPLQVGQQPASHAEFR
jgi:hypothetical protein